MPRSDDQGLLRMEEDDCWRFLSRHVLGRVALVHLGSPMVFPVHYALDGRSIVFRTAPGTKLKLAATGARVAFEVDESDALFETGSSVVVHGLMTEVVEPKDVARLRALPLRVWAPGARDHIIRIEPEHTTGRQIAMHQRDDGVEADGG